MLEPRGKTTVPLQEETTIKQKAKMKKLWLRMTCLYVSMITGGAAKIIVGPCMLDLRQLYDKDTSSISSSLVGNRLGFIAGTVLAGLLYHRFNKDLQNLLGCLLIALFTCLATYLGGFAGFVAFLLCQGISLGFVITGISPYLLDLWQGHRLKNSLLQGAHAALMLGQSIAPLIVNPFLTDNPIGDHITTLVTPNKTLSLTINVTTFMTSTLSSSNDVHYEGNIDTPFNNYQRKLNITHQEIYYPETQVQLGFLVIGLMCVTTVVLWSLAFLSGEKHLKVDKLQVHVPNGLVLKKTSYQRHSKVAFLGLVSLMMLSYMIQETAVVIFLPSYVVKSLKWTNHQGALIASMFWAMVCVGRVIAIPISAFVKPSLVIFVDIILSVFSSFVLLLGTFKHFPTTLTWVSTAFLGLGFSSFWASAFLWTACYMDIEGKISAIYYVLGSVGAIIAPFLTGHTFQYYTPKSFVYIVFGGAILSIVLFILAYICTHFVQSQDIRNDLQVVQVSDDDDMFPNLPADENTSINSQG